MSDEVKTAPTAEEAKIQLGCPVHGDITRSTLVISLENLAERDKPRKEGDPEPQPVQFLYCMHCVNDLLLGLQKEDKLPKVSATKVEPEATDEVKAEVIN